MDVTTRRSHFLARRESGFQSPRFQSQETWIRPRGLEILQQSTSRLRALGAGSAAGPLADPSALASGQEVERSVPNLDR